jgi:iron-sulfur cluster insertion protein
MSEADVIDQPVRLSAAAARRVAEIVAAENNPALRLRIAVSGGGCSGFQYGFTLDDSVNDDDVKVERDGVELLVDPVTLDFMRGAEVDYVEDLAGASFQIRNPNAKTSCGCGTSFSV